MDYLKAERNKAMRKAYEAAGRFDSINAQIWINRAGQFSPVEKRQLTHANKLLRKAFEALRLEWLIVNTALSARPMHDLLACLWPITIDGVHWIASFSESKIHIQKGRLYSPNAIDSTHRLTLPVDNLRAYASQAIPKTAYPIFRVPKASDLKNIFLRAAQRFLSVGIVLFDSKLTFYGLDDLLEPSRAELIGTIEDVIEESTMPPFKAVIISTQWVEILSGFENDDTMEISYARGPNSDMFKVTDTKRRDRIAYVTLLASKIVQKFEELEQSTHAKTS